MAIKELRERMALTPDRPPEPPIRHNGGAMFGMLGRRAGLVALAAVAAYGVVSGNQLEFAFAAAQNALLAVSQLCPSVSFVVPGQSPAHHPFWCPRPHSIMLVSSPQPDAPPGVQDDSGPISPAPQAVGQQFAAQQSTNPGASRSDIRPDEDASIPIVISAQRPLGKKTSEKLTMADVETAAATPPAQGPEQRRRISSLTNSEAAPQTDDAAMPVAAPLLTPQFQPTAAVADDPPAASPLGPRVNENEAWVVQLSAQRTEAEAQSAFHAAQTKYAVLARYQPLIRKKDQGQRGVFYAAQLGPLSRDDANKLCNKLRNAGGSCFVQKN